MYTYRTGVAWETKLNSFGRNLLWALGCDPDYLPTDHNPIIRALADGDFVERYGDLDGFNMKSVSTVATICQMVVYDANGGPDGDRKPKGLRRQWYAWFKTRFAQPFSKQLNDKTPPEKWGIYWNGRQSTVYADLVDNSGVTYRDLWVDDASRMMDEWYETLFSGFNVIVAVEKDSLFADFKAAAHALGAKSLVSGKGKQSKAATEKQLREHFGWRPDRDPFSEENPLIVLHISDHDMDGEAVIGPTFGNQATRYTDHILEARVGIKPGQVEREEWGEHWYEVKTSNNGYIGWAEREAVFAHECACGETWLDVGVESQCPFCLRRNALSVKVNKELVNQPYGFEVEALPTSAYSSLLVDALLTVVSWDHIVSRLRDECQANSYDAARRVQQRILNDNASYQALLKEFDRLEEIKAEFEDRVAQELRALGEPHVGDWRDEEDDPEVEDFQRHVETARDYTGPWRPFSRDLRTTKLVEWLEENETSVIDQFTDEVLDW